jgi:NADH-quinone oxidoreductase subunit C
MASGNESTTAAAAELPLAFLRAKGLNATERASSDHPAVNVPIGELVSVLGHLKTEQAFDMLMDLTAIDWAEGASPRFTVVYHLYSTTRNAYVRVAADCASNTEPSSPSVASLWPGANWHERECYDLMGVKFTGHPDLRRILMWEGFPHHPLRKDFPLAGIETALPDEEVGSETGTRVLAAPMAGGPFVAAPGEINLTEAEPRAKDESWADRRPRPDQGGLRQVKE